MAVYHLNLDDDKKGIIYKGQIALFALWEPQSNQTWENLLMGNSVKKIGGNEFK